MSFTVRVTGEDLALFFTVHLPNELVVNPWCHSPPAGRAMAGPERSGRVVTAEQKRKDPQAGEAPKSWMPGCGHRVASRPREREY